MLRDLGSKNGTLLGEAAVSAIVELSDGDEPVFGDVRVKLRSWSTAAEAETKRIPLKR